MSAKLIEFNPYLIDAVAMMALSPKVAWRLEMLMESDDDFTEQDELAIVWINLVNTPVELLEAH